MLLKWLSGHMQKIQQRLLKVLLVCIRFIVIQKRRNMQCLENAYKRKMRPSDSFHVYAHSGGIMFRFYYYQSQRLMFNLPSVNSFSNLKFDVWKRIMKKKC